MMRIRQPVLVLAALLLAACASDDSSFDISFSHIDGIHDDRQDRIDAANEAEIAPAKNPGADALIIRDGDTA